MGQQFSGRAGNAIGIDHKAMPPQNQGSHVLDFSAKGDVVWRGVAQASIKPDAPAAKREALLRDAIREVLKRFPPKP